MHTLQIFQASQEPLSLDETGDYIEWLRHPCGLIHSEKYGTLFDVRRSSPYEAPQVDFTYARGSVPAQPQPVSLGPPSLLSSVWGYISSQSMTGDQADILLGGPDRPVPQPKPQPQRRGSTPASRSSMSPGRSGSPTSLTAQSVANNAASGVSNLYSRLGNALAERGEMLGSLEDSFKSLESGSKSMLAQAKGLAMKQGAKRWFDLS
ncbi:hypothetical protein NM688_g6131 [Phlebia brevispora]|uniref:Uncharacterized protein n=1 Tax=Phlebia brevispora TaxID=194682 RepID=A0ACC1SJL2_9APHY|nr:hypothetical protein NM688_g6131 [Phlebia brevispora]